MRFRRWFALGLTLWIVQGSPALRAQPQAAASTQAKSPAAKALEEVMRPRRAENEPGMPEVTREEREVGLAAEERRYKENLDKLTRLKTIDRAALTPDEQLAYDAFARLVETQVGFHEVGWDLVPLNQRGGIQLTRGPEDPRTVADYERWIRRMRGFSKEMDGTIELMREGVRRKIVQSKTTMGRVKEQIARQAVTDPEKSPFYEPFRKFPTGIPETERERLRKEGREAIASVVLPAFAKFQVFFNKEYYPACFDQPGIWQAPNGKELYAKLARLHTTTTLTPEQIHEIGLKEVARIKSEMLTLLPKTGFKGSLGEFFVHLRTDPKFYYKDPETLLMAYRATAKRVDPRLTRAFKLIPRQPYGVEPIPMLEAPDTTAAYYGRNTYWVNLYQPESRPKWEMMALTLHESVPGHHFTAAFAQERPRPGLQAFGFTAYSEGWGLYAESLGEEMGLYDDPYDKFGQLIYDMWRAVRLVVDTGMHYYGWSRQRAIDYFLENAGKTELDVVNEIDRYIAWPGQALAYKIGELKIKELRSRAEKSLGARFQLKDFHEAVLGTGSVPLDVLEREIDNWIVRQKSRPN
jgi:uncharacterized protein (DUF885 family)